MKINSLDVIDDIIKMHKVEKRLKDEDSKIADSYITCNATHNIQREG